MAVEPVKEYNREKTQVYDIDAPLNHLVDAVSPESDQARYINELALRATRDPSVRPELRAVFLQWRDNDALLEPYLATSMLRKPLVPLSQNLSVLGGLGMDALDAIDAARPVTPEQRNEQLTKVKESAVPHAELFLVVTPAVRTLIEAEPGVR